MDLRTTRLQAERKRRGCLRTHRGTNTTGLHNQRCVVNMRQTLDNPTARTVPALQHSAQQASPQRPHPEPRRSPPARSRSLPVPPGPQPRPGPAYILESLEAAPPVTLATRSWDSSTLRSSSCFSSSSFFFPRRSRALILACGQRTPGHGASGPPLPDPPGSPRCPPRPNRPQPPLLPPPSEAGPGPQRAEPPCRGSWWRWRRGWWRMAADGGGAGRSP